MSRSAREDILGAVRSALTRKRSDTPQETKADPRADIAAGIERVTPATTEALVAQFAGHLEAIGADFRRAPTAADATGAVAEYLRNAGARTLAFSPAPGLEALGSGLVAEGFEVDTLDENQSPDPHARLAAAHAAVTGTDFALADTGTLVFTPETLATPLHATLPPCHVAVVSLRCLVPHLWALFQQHPEVMAGPLFFVTGPSRTADIEKQLVLGAHGPSKVLVVGIED